MCCFQIDNIARQVGLFISILMKCVLVFSQACKYALRAGVKLELPVMLFHWPIFHSKLTLILGEVTPIHGLL